MELFPFLLESLQVRFLHIQPHRVDWNWRIDRRILRHSVLWYVERGEFTVTVGRETYRCRSGQLCLLPPDREIGACAQSADIRLVSLNFDAEIAFLSGRSWMEVLNVPVVIDGNKGELEPVIAEMTARSNEASPYVPLLMQSSLLRILYMLLDQSGIRPAKPAAGTMDGRVLTIIHYLLARPDVMPRMTELADLVQLSESHLRKLFVHDTRQSPLQFVHHMKIEQARRLLIGGSKPISQISRELGFEDANYFTRLFKSGTGLAPLTYRRANSLWLNQ